MFFEKNWACVRVSNIAFIMELPLRLTFSMITDENEKDTAIIVCKSGKD